MKWLKTKAANFVKHSLGNVYSDSSFFGSVRVTGQEHAGVDVNYTTAMKFVDVYTCVRIKSESVGQLPLKLYRKDSKGVKRQIHSGREHKIFTLQPNEYQTWQEFIETYVTVIEIIGNFYAEIKRNRYGNVYEIVPFRYQNNVSENMDANGQVYYTYATNDGKGKISKRTYASKDILHIKLNNTDGFRGLSPITQAAQELGLAMAGSNHAASLFKNGARPSAVLQTDQTFGDDDNAVARLRKTWHDAHGGSANSGKTAILEAGLKYQSVQMSSVDAQLLEHSKFSREKIASIFRIPSHMLNAADSMKYNSIEHNNTGFFRDALMPLVTKLENNLNLILPDNHVVSMDETQFVRGDRKTQVETSSAILKVGLCSIDEGRAMLDLPPLENGDGEMFAIVTNNITFGRHSEIEEDKVLNRRKLMAEVLSAERDAKEPPKPETPTPTPTENT